MRRQFFFALILGSLLFASPALVEAGVLYNFSGMTPDGTVGSASMLVQVDGLKLTATLDNTSPVTGNTEPFITSFGFDLKEVVPSFTNWSLTAKNNAGNSVVIGNMANNGDYAIWRMWVDAASQGGNQPPGAGLGTLTLDYLTGSSTQNTGRLYNPVHSPNMDSPPQFYTSAVLEMYFDSEPEIHAWVNPNNSQIGSPWVRFQGVGDGNDNSLKLVGLPEGPGPGPLPGVPEPSALAVWGLIGIVGLAWRIRRKVRA